MIKNHTLCIKHVGEEKKCEKCSSPLIKYGKTSYGKQRFFCKICKVSKILSYTYKAYLTSVNNNIIALLKEACGIRSIARLLEISTSTVLKRIVSIAKQINPPIITKRKTYEVDELCTFISNKKQRYWLVCCFCRETKNIVRFTIGKRSNKTLRRVIDTLALSSAKYIYTDGLCNYKSIIPKKMHKVKRYATNHIERAHLTIRTHIKRLQRRTICYTKSLIVFSAIMTIYFWS